MDENVDGKVELVNRIEKLIHTVEKKFGKTRTDAMDWVGEKLGFKSGRKQVYNLLNKLGAGEEIHNISGLELQLDKIEEELGDPPPREVSVQPPPTAIAKTAGQSSQGIIGVDTLMTYVIDLAMKYGELKNAVESHKEQCGAYKAIEKTIEKHKKQV